MISTQMAADVMYHELGFPNIILHFKVNKSEFNVMVAISSHPVEALKNHQKTHKNTHKKKQDGSLGAFFD